MGTTKSQEMRSSALFSCHPSLTHIIVFWFAFDCVYRTETSRRCSNLSVQAKEYYPNGLNPEAEEFIPVEQVRIFN